MSQITIEELYIAYLGRAADPAGLNYWLTQEAAGVPDTTIALQFVPQPETLALYPLLSTPALLETSPALEATFINAVYQNLFGHAADSAGLSYWQGLLTAGANPGLMVDQIILGAQGTDATTMLNRATVAAEYTNAVLSAVPVVTWNPANDTPQSRSIIAGITASSVTVTAAAPLIAADIALDQSGSNGTGVTITLTGGGQTISPASTTTAAQTTAANDTVRGILGGQAPGTANASQLTTNDNINGGGGVNTLNSVLDNEAIVAPVLANMQIVNLAPGRANQTFNGASSTGITTLSLAGGLFAGDGDTAGSTLNVTGIGSGTAVGMMNASGINDNLNVTFSGLTGTANSATVVFNNNVGGGAFDTIASAGIGINTYNIQSNGTQANVAAVNGGDSALTTMNISGADPITLFLNSAGVTAINGSAATGNQTIHTGALTSAATLTGGSGNDTLDATSATKAVTLSDGAGNDTLIFNGGTASNVINAGSGADLVQTGGSTGLTFITASDLTTNAALTADVDVLNNYSPGKTSIDLQGMTGNGYVYDSSLTATQLATATAASSLLAAANTVAALINGQGLSKQVVAFAFGGNEYIYQDAMIPTSFASGDGLLQVTGAASTFKVSDLSLT